MLFMRNDFRGKEVCKRGRISRANSEGHSNPSLSVGHVPRVIRTPHPPPRQGFGKPRGASAASPRPSPPGDYKSHPALRSRTLRQSKMADTTASAGAGSSGMRSGSKQSTNPADNYHLARRRTLQVVVSSLLTEAGFESAEKASVETLTEMLQSCFNVDTLPAYAKRSQRMVITAPPVTNQPVTPKALTAGQNRPHPPHIPSHFPEFPDPHTYIKTPTYREPVSDYQVLREKAASQRRDVERALTRFMAKTGETQSLFKDDVSTFPLIAARPFTIPYLTALLPSELEMQQMEETDSSEQEEQTDTENLPLHISTDDSGAEKENTSVLQQNSLSGSRSGEESLIDNPYLRPVKKPKIRRKKLDWGIGAAGDVIHYHRTSFIITGPHSLSQDLIPLT
ncbi:transcription initiation factor TFIID subunit 8 isoform X4 [Pipistrellus kuhlii]|uniref:transcription initiation factor TFIID subunit 8 isoform X4 n=1 Tax=Pipistrellus kuhlii TaxID=59472 RepID=UPI001E27162A|nr:transcription initiation factor TFIID subunit 8 isoform X4 [Pipistrellus kuhlii]